MASNTLLKSIITKSDLTPGFIFLSLKVLYLVRDEKAISFDFT